MPRSLCTPSSDARQAGSNVEVSTGGKNLLRRQASLSQSPVLMQTQSGIRFCIVLFLELVGEPGAHRVCNEQDVLQQASLGHGWARLGAWKGEYELVCEARAMGWSQSEG